MRDTDLAEWALQVTTTTLGYGDVITTTHLGRFVSCMTAIIGTLCVALLTAAFSHILQWTPDEISAMMVLDREKARRLLHAHAVRLLAGWYRRQKYRRLKDAGSLNKKLKPVEGGASSPVALEPGQNLKRASLRRRSSLKMVEQTIADGAFMVCRSPRFVTF